MAQTIAYKVVGVFKEDGQQVRHSLIYDKTENKYALVYPPRELVLPYNNSLIFAFKTPQQCFNFIHESLMEGQSAEVWEVYVTDPKPIEKVLCLSYGEGALEVFWRKFNEGEYLTPTSEPPEGTVGCTSVQLNRRMYGITKFDTYLY